MDYDSWKLATPDKLGEYFICENCLKLKSQSQFNIKDGKEICSTCFGNSSIDSRVFEILEAVKNKYIKVNGGTELILKIINEVRNEKE